ncbi:nicotinamide-nucleotide amidase [Litorivivens lipolytica]|uniref:CinA-like protein n=1 Tax=Litorivivens lipolytica TaxID=1524264 RepID=A0A7W4W2B5_9GAMM|nr:CinA family nicotinamide mononucleotide deamidase-related protein [Litorivivens lipolytica]MBB3046104.1 nicotinamide-nucleotide amidase [Litorivivens lipolytica]
MKIQVLLTGNEIMSGDIVDSNSSMMADLFSKYGWRIARKVTVGDEMETLVEEIRSLSSNSDVLIINGGLGPTVDDLTAQAMAEASGQPLAIHPDAMAHLETWCGRRQIQINDANRKQTLLPKGCAILANETGSAVGIQMELNGCLVYATPGVPSELRWMLRHEVLPQLLKHFPSGSVETRRLLVFGSGESTLQQLISNQYPDWPDSIELGFRASMPALEVKLTTRAANSDELDTWQQRLIDDIFQDCYIANAPNSLAQATIDALYREQLHVATAESCTGGMIASQLTDIPGASQVFEAGWVTYSNAMKQSQLGVPAGDLEHFGAVSEPVARAMAEGAKRHSGADISVAVTGIAGPDGGSEQKPVGTVWIALATPEETHCYALQVPFERSMFRRWVSACCLDLIRRAALGLTLQPRYLARFQNH